MTQTGKLARLTKSPALIISLAAVWVPLGIANALPLPQAPSTQSDGAQHGGANWDPAKDKDNGTAESCKPPAIEQAQDYMRVRKWKPGVNKTATPPFIALAASSAIEAVGKEDFVGVREQAFDTAMSKAREAMADFLAAEISVEIDREHQKGQGGTQATADASKPESGVAPGAVEKVKALLNHELDEQLRKRGIDPSLDSPEAIAKREQATQEIKKELLGSKRFRDAVKLVAEHEVSGLCSFKTYEQVSADGSGDVAVVVVHSPAFDAVRRALLGLGAPVTRSAGTPVFEWAMNEGPNKLLYSHGALVKADETGELVVVGFGQAMPSTDSASVAEMARETATLRAKEAIRLFMGVLVTHAADYERDSTLDLFLNQPSEFTQRDKYLSTVKERAGSLKMPGMLPAYHWSFKHPQAPGKTKIQGAVVTYSVSDMLAANDLRAEITAASAAAGGAGGSTVRSKKPDAAHPTASRPTGKSSQGEGVESDDP